jgi:uncharacterized protein (TIGR03083 family)
MPETHALAYSGLRIRVHDVLDAAGPDVGSRRTPATPEWTIHDVLAHLVGVTDDVVHGRLEGIATDPWTASQVEQRRGRSVDDLLAEWDEHGPGFEEIMAAAPAEITGQALFDAATHEHDIRNALGMPGARDSDAVVIAWEWFVDSRTRGGGAAIRFVTDAGDQIAGVGEPVATVKTSRFELVRAITGRRSASEIESYGWEPAPQPELLLGAPMFKLRTEPLGE